MDYEKLHKDTITKLQEMVNSGKITVETARGICEDFIPESEDERIRKALIHFISEQDGFLTAINGISVKDITAWLESKGEQKPVWSEEDEKMIENIIDTIDMSIEDCDVDDIGTKARFSLEKERDWLKNKLKSLKDRVQPKQEWSEEDERFLNVAINILNSSKVYTKSPDKYEDTINWLKSIKDRVQPQSQQEWGEEIENCAREAEDNNCSILAKHIRQLKFLRPQSTWKPSDEQMEILQYLCETSSHPNEKVIPILESLYQDLKKLRGE